MARPTEFSPTIAARICEEIADGESLSEVCKADGMPHRSTVYDWLGREAAEFKGFADNYARAVEARAEKLCDEIIDIADEAAIDATTEKVAAARGRVDARKWVASKLFPRKFGDKVTNELTGPGGSAPNFVVSVTLVKPNDPPNS